MIETVMCLSCGEFVQAVERDGQYVPQHDACPDCGGGEFEHNDTGTIVRADD